MAPLVTQAAPAALRPGDVVLEEGGLLRVAGEPLAVLRGCGPFDELRVMVGVRVCDPAGGPSSFRVWPRDAVLALVAEAA